MGVFYMRGRGKQTTVVQSDALLGEENEETFEVEVSNKKEPRKEPPIDVSDVDAKSQQPADELIF